MLDLELELVLELGINLPALAEVANTLHGPIRIVDLAAIEVGCRHVAVAVAMLAFVLPFDFDFDSLS